LRQNQRIPSGYLEIPFNPPLGQGNFTGLATLMVMIHGSIVTKALHDPWLSRTLKKFLMALLFALHLEL
jgi:hypothetical protein